MRCFVKYFLNLKKLMCSSVELKYTVLALDTAVLSILFSMLFALTEIIQRTC